MHSRHFDTERIIVWALNFLCRDRTGHPIIVISAAVSMPTKTL